MKGYSGKSALTNSKKIIHLSPGRLMSMLLLSLTLCSSCTFQNNKSIISNVPASSIISFQSNQYLYFGEYYYNRKALVICFRDQNNDGQDRYFQYADNRLFEINKTQFSLLKLTKYPQIFFINTNEITFNIPWHKDYSPLIICTSNMYFYNSNNNIYRYKNKGIIKLSLGDVEVAINPFLSYSPKKNYLFFTGNSKNHWRRCICYYSFNKNKAYVLVTAKTNEMLDFPFPIPGTKHFIYISSPVYKEKDMLVCNGKAGSVCISPLP